MSVGNGEGKMGSGRRTITRNLDDFSFFFRSWFRFRFLLPLRLSFFPFPLAFSPLHWPLVLPPLLRPRSMPNIFETLRDVIFHPHLSPVYIVILILRGRVVVR